MDYNPQKSFQEHVIYLDPKGASTLIKVEIQTLANWRMLGKGPPYIKTGERLVRYRYDDLIQWLNKQRIVPDK